MLIVIEVRGGLSVSSKSSRSWAEALSPFLECSWSECMHGVQKPRALALDGWEGSILCSSCKWDVQGCSAWLGSEEQRVYSGPTKKWWGF